MTSGDVSALVAVGGVFILLAASMFVSWIGKAKPLTWTRTRRRYARISLILSVIAFAWWIFYLAFSVITNLSRS